MTIFWASSDFADSSAQRYPEKCLISRSTMKHYLFVGSYDVCIMHMHRGQQLAPQLWLLQAFIKKENYIYKKCRSSHCLAGGAKMALFHVEGCQTLG